MIEANMTFLWLMQGGIDAKDLGASRPVSLSQAQSELGCDCVGKATVSMHKYADMGISTPMPAFSFTGNTSQPQI